jgi:elongation factor Ts
VAEFTAKDVQRLRQETGAGMMDCKRALEETAGDLEKAKDLLRQQHKADAKKYSTRSASEGLVDAYLHVPDPKAGVPAKVGVLLELDCATDFVAKTDRFKALAREISMHISWAQPSYVSREDVPDDVREREEKVYRGQAEAEGKKPEQIDRIVEGKMGKFYAQNCLLEQPWHKDDKGKKTIGDLIDEASAELKEPIVVRRFANFRVGAE